MKAVQANFLEFLRKSPQFIIPIYQRNYSWTDRECVQLWQDIIRTGSNDKVSSHFVGSIVYVEKGLYQVTTASSLLVIDGQQRLTTLILLLKVLSNALGNTELLESFSAEKINGYYLLNKLESAERRYKLVLTQTDDTTLKAIITDRPIPDSYSLKVKATFDFFQTQISQLGRNLETLCKGLAKLTIVDISLDRTQDNPQLIFESLNSTGKELSQADLIRNYILMGLEPQLQTRLFIEYWRPMEEDFGQEAYDSQFDSFMRHYLTVKTGTIPNVSEVYQAFKDYSTSPKRTNDLEALMRDLRAFSSFYCAMALGKENDQDLRSAFQDIRELKVEVAFPFMLELYSDWKGGSLTNVDFLSVLRLIESYVFRRAVCEIPTNSLNKTFANFSRSVKKDRYLESIKAAFLLLPSYRRFPKDEELQRDIVSKDLYNFRNRSYWLRRMENYDRKERVVVDDYTIEHIMPQNENVPLQWQAELGPDWKRIWETYLHTLGNLTLTGYNSEYSDRPFQEKRDMKGGFRESPIRLNQTLGQLDHWREQEIIERAKRLAELATNVWPLPELDPEILKLYIPTKPKQKYSLDDHPYLSSGPMHDLFSELDKQIMGLDQVVSEEFLKLYVAFKAETNFVDIIGHQKYLELVLNMPFPEIQDPRQICKYVTSGHHWGNGEIQVSLSQFEEIPYVMGLIRQSFERQMGNDIDEGINS